MTWKLTKERLENPENNGYIHMCRKFNEYINKFCLRNVGSFGKCTWEEGRYFFWGVSLAVEFSPGVYVGNNPRLPGCGAPPGLWNMYGESHLYKPSLGCFWVGKSKVFVYTNPLYWIWWPSSTTTGNQRELKLPSTHGNTLNHLEQCYWILQL